jgi:transcription-repair coupling factor (superfamily II helicase)
LPDDYINDVNTRLSLYKKLASCKNEMQIREFQIELIDRFGLLPAPAKNLVSIAQMKLDAHQVGVKKIEATSQGGVLEFAETADIDPGFVIRLIQAQPNVYKLDGPQKIRFKMVNEEPMQRMEFIANMLDKFKQQQRAA